MEKRFLGIDLGQKRIGLAVTDPLNITVQRLKTLIFENKKKLIQDIKDVIEEKNICTIVFGVPITLSGKESKKTIETRKIIDYIKVELPDNIQIELEDEAMSTMDAHEILHNMGKKPSKNRDIVDQIAAQCILQSYKNRLPN